MSIATRPDADPATPVAELRIGDRVFSLPIEVGTEGYPAINVSALLKDAGVTTLDYGYANTASTRSAITFLDGEAGVLRYRGYPIEQLAEQSTFLETAYLLLYGELPTEEQLADVDLRRAAPHAPPRGVQAVLRRLPHGRPPDGDPVLGRQRPLHLLPGLG